MVRSVAGSTASKAARITGALLLIVSLATLALLVLTLQFSVTAGEGATPLALPVNIALCIIAAFNVAKSFKMTSDGNWTPLRAYAIYSVIALALFGVILAWT